MPAAAPLVAVGEVSTGATVAALADRVRAPVDSVLIYRLGAMRTADIDALEQVGVRLAIPVQRGRSFNIGMTSVRRGGAYVQLASGTSGLWQFPMAVTALPVEAVGRVMSYRVAGVVASGGVVLGSTSAGLRGAQAGDVLDLVTSGGATAAVRVGLVAPDDEIGGAELVMSTDLAQALGQTTVTRVLFFGQFDRDRLIAELAAAGYVDGTAVRITRSWGPRNPDDLLSSSQLKALLGEFDYRINTDDSLSVDPDWRAANVPPSRTLYRSIAVLAACHRRIEADLQAALDEVAARGLAAAIELASTNSLGGCFSPRYARLSSSSGSVSRHTWAMAIDMNVLTNGQGSVPRMNCDVVRIFRSHGFAWGGNFLVPDGMHFEWVGEPRHLLPYPSKYCPNDVVSAQSAVITSMAETAAATMFAADGLPIGTPSDR